MFTNLRPTRRGRARAQRPSDTYLFRPLLEGLEDRYAPATLHEFFVPVGSPMGITAGPDGNVWYTALNSQGAAGQVGKITPAGDFTSFSLGRSYFIGGPNGITTGPDGNLWSVQSGITYKFQPTLSYINRTTPEGMVTEFSIPANLSQGNITSGPDGNLWFTAVGNIGRITPGGVVTLFPTPSERTGSHPIDITTGPDGNLWFSDMEADAIGRIAPTGTITEFALPATTDAAGPFGITAGPDGNLWFTRHNIILLDQRTDQIGRITPTGTITLFNLPTPGSYPQDITAGSDGALWFTEGTSNIGRITLDGVITETPLPWTDRFPGAITTGPDGNLWFTEADRRLGQLVIVPSHAPKELVVLQLYRDLLGREADPEGLASWSGLLDRGQSLGQVVQGIQASQEYRTDVVTQLYVQLLQRGPDPSGLQTGSNLLAQGGTLQQLEAQLLGSAEYFTQHGATNAGFLEGVYEDVLGRTAAPGEAQPWLQLLAAGASRQSVATGIVNSPEAATDATQQCYLTYLDRAADPSGLLYFVNALQQGVGYQQVIAVVVASPEWFTNVTAETHQAWVTQVYGSVLQRPPDAQGLAYWTALLNSGGVTPFQVGLQIALSTESEAVFVQQAYLHYLNRGAGPDEVQLGAQFLTSGGTREQFHVMLTSSPEYYQKAGGTDAAFLNALYLDALGRPIDPSGAATFRQALVGGATRAQVAAAIFSSDEYGSAVIQKYYQAYLARTADAEGLAGWMQWLRQGARDEQVMAGILSADEYFMRWA